MTKILITGSNSFIGTNFRRFSKYREIEEVSLSQNKTENIGYSRYDVILHLAAIVHQSKKITDNEYFRVNRDLCLKVAENAKKAGVRQFVFLSTLKVYGDIISDHYLRTENSTCFPDDSYGKSKYEAEIGLKKMENDNFTISIIRPSLVYGIGVKSNMLSIVKLIEFFPILPLGSISNKRNFIYTENLVGFIDRIIEKKASGVFIAKDDDAISTTQLASYLAESLDRKVTLFKLPKFFISAGTFLLPSAFSRLFGSFDFDNSETKKILNYTPYYSTEQGIKKWLADFKSGKPSNNGKSI
jgi:nucleoside-diphosphate-sugar epimerase